MTCTDFIWLGEGDFWDKFEAHKWPTYDSEVWNILIMSRACTIVERENVQILYLIIKWTSELDKSLIIRNKNQITNLYALLKLKVCEWHIE